MVSCNGRISSRNPSSRSTSGCLTCRMRRKKCDERKPACVGCERNGLICSWTPIEGTPGREKRFWRKRLAAGSAGPNPTSPIASRRSSQPEAASSTQNHDVLQPPSLGPLSTHRLSPFSPGFRRRLAAGSSATLLDHFVQVSAPQLSGRVVPENPFLTHFLPLAYANDHVLQALLAVSGGHLYCRLSQFEHSTRSHYAVALRSVKHRLSGWADKTPADTVSLLAATILLSIFEVVTGNTDGSLFYHLRASREILLLLRKQPLADSLANDLDFLTEQYAFLAICANITLRTDFPLDRDIPADELVHSLHMLNRDSRSYGVMFGLAHQLYEIIPRIIQSAREALNGSADTHTPDLVKHYETQILNWQPVSDNYRRSEAATGDVAVETDTDLEISGFIYQQAVLVFLYSAFNGQDSPSAELESQIDGCLDVFLQKLTSIPQGSHMATTLMWPVLVAGSCMRRSEQRSLLSCYTANSPFQMWCLRRIEDLLDSIWEAQDADRSIYGIYGLELVMRRKRLNICVG